MKKLLLIVFSAFLLSASVSAQVLVPLTVCIEDDEQPGSTLRIINGGIIETRNGFEAPIGVVVDIVSGQIL